MPVVAVGFAVALDVGAVGALAAGTLTTLAAITAIGATVSAVGAVTGNKTLSMVGMGLGIVGAVGTLASGAGLFDNTEALFGSSSAGGTSALDAADASAAAGAAGTNAADNVLSEATGSLPDITTATGAIDQAALSPAGAIDASTQAAEGNAAAIESGGDAGGPLAGSLQGPTATASTAGTPQVSAFAPNAGTAAGDNLSTFDQMLPPGLERPAAFLQSPADLSSGSVGSGLMDWAKNNPLLSYGLIQAGGSFISGLTNPMTPAQIDALNAQSEVNRATAALIQRETANQSGPLPSATVATPAVTGRVEQPAGLINNSPSGTPLITGAPNLGAAQKQLVTGTTA